jgi:hypothetical protein
MRLRCVRKRRKGDRYERDKEKEEKGRKMMVA